MDCFSAISLLLCQIVCINITTISSDQKQQLADTLDRLLRYPGWINIKARAKYQIASNEIKSFSGSDLYKLDLDLNEEYDVNLENRIVTVKNVDKKYVMITHLLGCVYTGAMLTYLQLLDIILLQSKKEKRRSKYKIRQQLKKKSAKHSTNEDRVLTLEDSVDYTNSKIAFNTAMEQMENHKIMLDFMSTALHYLERLPLFEKTQNELIRDLQRIRFQIGEIKNIVTYIDVMVPRDNTTSNDEKTFSTKLKFFSGIVSKSININKEEPLVKFKNSYCILPENERIEPLYYEYQSDIIIAEMQKLANEVCTSFYKYLGFVFVDQTTIIAPGV